MVANTPGAEACRFYDAIWNFHSGVVPVRTCLDNVCYACVLFREIDLLFN